MVKVVGVVKVVGAVVWWWYGGEMVAGAGCWGGDVGHWGILTQ